MIKISEIDHIKIEVKDVKATYAFYKTFFGFIVLVGTEELSTIIGNDQVKL